MSKVGGGGRFHFSQLSTSLAPARPSSLAMSAAGGYKVLGSAAEPQQHHLGIPEVQASQVTRTLQARGLLLSSRMDGFHVHSHLWWHSVLVLVFPSKLSSAETPIPFVGSLSCWFLFGLVGNLWVESTFVSAIACFPGCQTNCYSCRPSTFRCPITL